MSRHPARVVILGGGFAGLYAASYLVRADLPEGAVEVTMISDRNYFTFLPLLPEVVGGMLGEEEVAFPLRAHARRVGFRFLRAEVESIEPPARRVHTSLGVVDYDFLVITLGARANYFGNEELARNAMPLVSIQDALKLRSHLLRTVEAAAQERSAIRRGELLSFAVAGGGPSGVEVASEILRMLDRVSRRDHGLTERVRLTLVHGGDRILQGWDETLADEGLELMRKRGIDVRLRTRVEGFDNGTVQVRLKQPAAEPGRFRAEALVWTAGTRPATNPLAKEVLDSGHLPVDATLRVLGQDRIFAAGDNARLDDPRSGHPYPPVAPIAISQGIRVAANIENAIVGRDLEAYHAYHAGKIVSLGGGQALVDILGWRAGGRTAWLLYRAVTLSQLVGARNKLRTLTSLMINRLFEPADIFD
ncbi:pyridine nucleotide-disulfide oxidoreductase [Litchfieldella qijiaojingensis]|uniref:Pyridine nucleotide-disulfide oxidoreductase n=1 Tax=Litchfieldella qijiaojingensis TaxID=980347 RepID=A0ABQ2YYM7_9GAMM|nr:NAD(P)/FAD-dependent oxidoreductase [Halomonas qijiaojingensis]GGX99700.1 pyridine nucleotide-disulfide oxidoreductase [Halomonas qijiaojingensis]